MHLTQSAKSETPAPPPPATPQNSVYLIMVLVGVLFLAVVYPRIRRRRNSRDRHEQLGTFVDPHHASPRDELERLLAEIQDLSREQIAKLDTKIRLLNQLLIECDQKKKELETLLGRTVSAGLAKLDPPPPSRPANPLHDQVYELQDAGKNVFDICSATGLEKGEVELILGLRKMPGKL